MDVTSKGGEEGAPRPVGGTRGGDLQRKERDMRKDAPKGCLHPPVEDPRGLSPSAEGRRTDYRHPRKVTSSNLCREDNRARVEPSSRASVKRTGEEHERHPVIRRETT